MGWCERCSGAGGIFALGLLISEHRSLVVADCRAIYHVSAFEVAGAEFWALIGELLADPTSRFHAAVAGWSYPTTYADMHMLDLIDVLLMRWMGNKFKPVPRPWDQVKRRGGKKRTAEEALRILRPYQFAQEPSPPGEHV